MYQKYLVTGAKNPVGRLVVQMLLAEGCEVRVLVPPESDYSLLAGMGAEVYEGEIFNKDSLKAFLTVDNPRQSAVIHAEEILAISEKKNLDMRRVNVAGTMNLVDMSMRSKIGRFAYLGSAYALNPNTTFDGTNVHFDRNKVEGDYAITKAEASAYIMEKVSLNKFNASLLLPTFIIGPGFPEDYDMNKIIKKYTESKVHTVSGGHAFVDVRDVASALVGICENGVAGGAYVLNGEYKSSKEFFEDISKTSGTETVKEVPKWAQKKSMAKLVDTFYRVAKKDNPKEVYALFMNNPSANFESTIDGVLYMEDVRKVHDSLEDALKRPGNEVVPDKIPAKAGEPVVKEEKPEEKVEEKKEDAAEEKESAIKIPKIGVIKEEPKEETPEEPSKEEPAEEKAEEVKAEETPIEEKTEDTKEEETPAEDKAVEETPAEETVEDTPAEEKPAEEVTAEPEKKEEEAPKLSVASLLAEAAAKREAEKLEEEKPAEEKAEEVSDETTEEESKEEVADETTEEKPAEEPKEEASEAESVEETPAEEVTTSEEETKEESAEETPTEEETTTAVEETAPEAEAPAEEETPSVEESPAEEVTTSEEETVAEEETPVAEETPAEEEAPAEAEAPTEEAAPATEEKVEEEAPAEEEAKKEEPVVAPAAKPIWETAPLDASDLDEDEFFKDLM